jgi:hypothetical protein
MGEVWLGYAADEFKRMTVKQYAACSMIQPQFVFLAGTFDLRSRVMLAKSSGRLKCHAFRSLSSARYEPCHCSTSGNDPMSTERFRNWWIRPRIAMSSQ